MFSKGKEKPAAPPADEEKPQVPSIISTGLSITGNLTSEGDIQLDGKVDGDVRTRKLTVGEDALINGKIEGDEITIAGTVNGEITGQTVRLTKTAHVTGDINHVSLSIDAGAFVEGLCKRIDTRPEAGKPALQIAAGTDRDGEAGQEGGGDGSATQRRSH